MVSLKERQRQQLQRFLDWKEAEGDCEGPVHLDTYLQPAQQRRIQWLKENSLGSILEVGCNWGYVLACVGGHAGVDIRPELVALASALAPERDFRVADAFDLPFPLDSFDTVLLTEVMEHLDPVRVTEAVKQALHVARRRVLITLPDGEEDSAEATCFKHRWLPTEDAVKLHITSLFAAWQPVSGFTRIDRWLQFIESPFRYILVSMES